MKKTAFIVMIFVLAALLVAFASPSSGQPANDLPVIHSASVQPTKVYPGDTMTVTAEVSDASGIALVTADMGGIETISLSLIEGSIYHGTWQGQWLVHDTSARDYVTTIIATNSLGKSASTDIVWRDPQTYERFHNCYTTQQESNVITPSWTDAHSMTFTPNTTGNFLVYSSATMGNESTSPDYTEVQTIYDSTVINTRQFTPAIASEKCTFGSHDVLSLTGDTSYTFKTQFRSSTTDTAKGALISDCRFTAFAVSDYHDTEGSASSTTSESYVNIATLTFTPATAGYYLIIASAEVAYNSTSESFYAQLYYNTSAASWGEVVRQPTATGDYHQCLTMRYENLANSSHTFYLQTKRQAGGSGTVSYRRARITAVRASDIGDVEYQSAEAVQSTKSTTNVVAATLNWDPATEGNYFRFGCHFLNLDNTGKFAYASMWEDSVLRTERDMQPNAVTDYIPLWGGCHSYLDDTAHAMEFKFRSSSPSAYANTINTRIFMISADTLIPFNDSGHDTYDNNFTEGENTVYIQGCYFGNTTNLHVAYYDANGYQWLSHGVASDANGVVNSLCTFTDYPTAAAGTWHAVIYDDSQTPAASYTASDLNSLLECSFVVDASAIPEFPTVFAAVGVAGLCFGVYWWMRRMAVARQTRG